MKIALISDIHANLPALESALEIAGEMGAERLVVAGDVVGDGPHPVQVISRLRDAAAECVRGNVDRRVLRMALGHKKLTGKLNARKSPQSNRAWTALQLRNSEQDLEWLSARPPELRTRAAGHELLVVHGSPLGDTDYIYPSITPDGLASKLRTLEGARPEILVCGHSHVPFSRDVDGVLVINCGSAGRSADGDPRGSLVLLELEAGAPARVQMLRFAYDMERLLTDLEELEVPGVDPEQYRRGVKQ
jgi:predicted phosphodiesterase